jgi:hypothetical protein
VTRIPAEAMELNSWISSSKRITTMRGDGVRVRNPAIILACLFGCLAIRGGSYAGDLEPYLLPPEARARIEQLAASSKVLILGEVHGTREVPRLVTGLLAPLNERGYRILALEVPNDAQAVLLAWARGETDKVPDFFATPNGDGRGNVQLLELVRTVIAPPFRWQVVCFDESEAMVEKRYQALTQKRQTGDADLSALLTDDAIALWREGDAAMASILLREVKALKSTEKILAICGNLHARIKPEANDPIVSKFWPSFAGMVKQGQPAWRVSSMDIEFSSGAYFNEGKVQTIRGRPIEHTEVRSAGQTEWDLVLSLPKASPAEFLSPNSSSPDGRAARSQTDAPRRCYEL